MKMLKAHEIDIKNLPSLPYEKKGQLPCDSGIYLLLDAVSYPLYIGMSTAIRFRWSGHEKKRFLKGLDKKLLRIAWIIERDYNRKQELERELIGIYNPPLNRKDRTQEKRIENPRFNLLLPCGSPWISRTTSVKP